VTFTAVVVDEKAAIFVHALLIIFFVSFFLDKKRNKKIKTDRKGGRDRRDMKVLHYEDMLRRRAVYTQQQHHLS